MKRRSRTLLVLGAAVALLAAAGGVAAWHPWSRPAAGSGGGPDAPAGAQFVTIMDVKADQIRSISLTSAAGTIELDNVEGAWKIVKPAPLALKQGPLNDLLYSVTTLSSERVIEERPKDLAPYGLDEARRHGARDARRR